MKRWAVLLCGLAVFLSILFAAYFAWAQHMYTVGMDVNLTAWSVLGVGLVVASVLVLVARRLIRSRRVDRD